MVFLLFLLFSTLVFCQDDNQPAEDLKPLLDARLRNSKSNEPEAAFHLQLESKTYSSPGITFENEDVIISGV
jgi:hypothetical protein